MCAKIVISLHGKESGGFVDLDDFHLVLGVVGQSVF